MPEHRPELVTIRNCTSELGLSWRHALGVAKKLGVPILRIGRKDAFSRQVFLDAVEREAVSRRATK